MGRALMVLGAVLLAWGLLFSAGGRLFGLGRLPGDIVVKTGSLTVYILLATSILLSLALTLVFRIFWR